MLKKNISLFFSFFLISSIVVGCGSTSPSDSSAKNQIAAKPDPVLANSPSANTQANEPISKADAAKRLIDEEILTILADQDLMLTDEGLKAAGITIVEDVAGNFSVKAEVNFYTELRDLHALSGKARTDKIAELRTKYPTYFKPVIKRPCWVYYPKFRYCNEDGT